jgi:CAS/CSE protein, C-terminus
VPAVVLLIVWGVTCPSRPCMQIAPVATVALGELAKKLLEVCKNPMQPHFNHFLFESVAALIHFGEF